MTQYGDYQLDIYFGGFEGQLPRYPVDFAALERAAAEVLPPWVYSYVAGGAGDEGTQRGNVEAFSRYGIVPRMLVGADPHPVRVILARGGGMGSVPEGGIQQLGRAPTPLALLACYLAHGHQRRVNAGARNYYEACGGRCPGHPGRGHGPSAHDRRHRPAQAGGPGWRNG
jgi:hypothetical protein